MATERMDQLLARGRANPGTLIDLRAPVEFRKGSVAGAVNLPILADSERHRVGLCYRERGQAAAIALGETLVSGARRSARVEGWVQVLGKAGGEAGLFCWRGGLRSRYAARWLEERGYSVEPLAGGYRALRQRCLQILDSYPARTRLLVLAGRTGVGKTELLTGQPEAVDLEGLAQHRGSAFGAQPRPQPTPVGFENTLASECLAHRARNKAATPVLLLEDESRTIGRIALPESWFRAMQRAPLVLLTATLEERIGWIEQEYVLQPLAAGTPPVELEARYQSAIHRIRKRLGGLRASALGRAISAAFAGGSHRTWIRSLLEDYYDPMYDYQLAGKQTRICFSGDQTAVREWLSSTSLAMDLV